MGESQEGRDRKLMKKKGKKGMQGKWASRGLDVGDHQSLTMGVAQVQEGE